MRVWWVNQNETFRQESQGGYLWSPKRSKGDRYNPYYDNMRVVVPDDLVLSFSDTLIRAIGIALGYCYECPKPAEFGSAGRNWNAIGWRVDMQFTILPDPIRPVEHMDVIRPTLPAKYSPLRANGHGNQAVYLTEIPAPMVAVLGQLIGPVFSHLSSQTSAVATDEKSRSLTDAEEMRTWEDHLLKEIEQNTTIADTERRALILARRGQGIFRERVAKVEKCCRITRVDRPTHLIASHSKPWRDSDHLERLDGENGFLLTPTVDHLFDRGFISFDDNGDVLISPVANKDSLNQMGIETSRVLNVGSFSSGQKHYLDFHRENVFLVRRSA